MGQCTDMLNFRVCTYSGTVQKTDARAIIYGVCRSDCQSDPLSLTEAPVSVESD